MGLSATQSSSHFYWAIKQFSILNLLAFCFCTSLHYYQYHFLSISSLLTLIFCSSSAKSIGILSLSLSALEADLFTEWNGSVCLSNCSPSNLYSKCLVIQQIADTATLQGGNHAIESIFRICYKYKNETGKSLQKPDEWLSQPMVGTHSSWLTIFQVQFSRGCKSCTWQQGHANAARTE